MSDESNKQEQGLTVPYVQITAASTPDDEHEPIPQPEPEPMHLGTPVSSPPRLEPQPSSSSSYREPRNPVIESIHRWKSKFSNKIRSVLAPCAYRPPIVSPLMPYHKPAICVENPLPGPSISAENPLPGPAISAENPLPGPSMSAENPLPGPPIFAKNPLPGPPISAENPLPGPLSHAGSTSYPMVVAMPRARPTSLIPSNVNVVFKDNKMHPVIITHWNGALIHDMQRFLVSLPKLARAGPDIVKKLGIKVSFKQSSKICKVPDCTVKCPECQVCEHLYSCSCPVKFLGTQWCTHIHIMHGKTQGVYLGSAVMFFHNNWRYTEMRHLRAFIQGSDKMEWIDEEGLWQEQFETLNRSERYRVQRLSEGPCTCPPDKVCESCTACLCRYACTCADYFMYRQVCQHIHIVVMKQLPNADYLFANYIEFGHEYAAIKKGGPDPRLVYYMELEHEMSYYFKDEIVDKRRMAPSRITEWHIPTITQPISAVVRENPYKKRECFCNSTNATKVNSCTRCKICNKHYMCTCEIQDVICRHIHAVIRYEKLSQPETVYDRCTYLNNLILAEEEIIGDTSDLPVRQPIGVIRRAPSAAHSAAASATAGKSKP